MKLLSLSGLAVLSGTDAFINGNGARLLRNKGLWASTSSESTDVKTVETTTTLEVCLSPGCLADGARLTLQKLQALSDGNKIRVQKGVCCSLCGNGPVVLNGNQKTRKVTSDDKILKLLLLAADDEKADPRMENILQSFDLIEQGRAAAKSRDFGKSAELFQKGVDLGTEQFSDRKSSLAQVSYLVAALQEQTLALLQLPDKESKNNAVKVARSSVELIKSSSDVMEGNCNYSLEYYSSLECLQEALEACNKGKAKADKGILVEELETLQELMALTEPLGLSSVQQNKRRSLGFRLQKLEKEAG